MTWNAPSPRARSSAEEIAATWAARARNVSNSLLELQDWGIDPSSFLAKAFLQDS
jgi:hypothetical protein